MTQYLQYNDPVRIIWRKGTTDDPYVDKTDTLKIFNNKIVLSEIPSQIDHVLINGYTEIYEGEPTSTQFIVNYQNGIVTFNSSEEGKTVTATYKGRGIIQYPAERIYLHNDNPDLIISLQQYIDDNAVLIWKPMVNTYSEIATVFPNPQKGWTTQTIDTGIRYRYDGQQWVPIQIVASEMYKIETRTSDPTSGLVNGRIWMISG